MLCSASFTTVFPWAPSTFTAWITAPSATAQSGLTLPPKRRSFPKIPTIRFWKVSTHQIRKSPRPRGPADEQDVTDLRDFRFRVLDCAVNNLFNALHQGFAQLGEKRTVNCDYHVLASNPSH